MSREDMYAVFVTVGGVPIPGSFDTLEGGAFDSEESTHRPGGMARQKSYGGPQTVENVTVSRAYEYERDYQIVRDLVPKRGRADATIAKQPLDANGDKLGQPDPVYTGKLKAVKYPDFDSNSEDVGMFELEFTVNG